MLKVWLNSHGEESTHVAPSRRVFINRLSHQQLRHPPVHLLHRHHRRQTVQLKTPLRHQRTHQRRGQRPTPHTANHHHSQPQAQRLDQLLHQLLILLRHQLAHQICSQSRSINLNASRLREAPHSILNKANTSQSLVFPKMPRNSP